MAAVFTLGVKILTLKWGKGHSRLIKSSHPVEWSHEDEQRSASLFLRLQLGGWVLQGVWILQNSARLCSSLIFTFEIELGVFMSDLLSLLWLLLLHDSSHLFLHSLFFLKSLITETYCFISTWRPRWTRLGQSSPFSQSWVKRTQKCSEIHTPVLNLSLSSLCYNFSYCLVFSFCQIRHTLV